MRWWPAGLVAGVTGLVIFWIRSRDYWSFQERNISTLSTLLGGLLLLFIWWLTLSRATWRVRWTVAGLAFSFIGTVMLVFRVRGVSGDLRPILELRWTEHKPATRVSRAGDVSERHPTAKVDFPQFLGPDRNAQLAGPVLKRDWRASPPSILWKQPVGSGWSGWAMVGDRAFTQEQAGEDECSTCYETLTGARLWSYAVRAHYASGLAGEGPRCTPTVASNRVFTLGATGVLSCLDATSGIRVWSRNIVDDARSRVPEWGFAGSPLVYDHKVIVSAGGTEDSSLLAYRIETGELVWHAGNRRVSYGSPFLATLSDLRQVLVFNSRQITAHDAVSGRVAWEYPWGNGQPQVAAPVLVSSNQVLFSSGYGVGSELLELSRNSEGQLSARPVWQSRKMKAKFANLVQRGGFLYGLDDGVLACVDLTDGSQRWKEGRYGHGQGLLVGDLFLLMAESGELVLLQLAPDALHELGRFRVFRAKTWNPIALAGDLLLVRNDQEAACVRLAIQ